MTSPGSSRRACGAASAGSVGASAAGAARSALGSSVCSPSRGNRCRIVLISSWNPPRVRSRIALNDSCAGARTSCVISSRNRTCWPTTALPSTSSGAVCPLAAVDRVAHLDAIEAEVVAGLDAHGDFFDVARAPVAARLQHLDDGLVVGDQLDQVVVREVHGIAVEQRRDVVLAVLRDLERRAC